jgi:hypothetical protein
VTIHKPAERGKENRSRDIGGGSVHFKGNIVGTNSRVVGIGNDRVNEFLSYVGRGTGDTLVVDLEEFSGVVGR